MADYNLRAAGGTAVQLFSLPLQFHSLNKTPRLCYEMNQRPWHHAALHFSLNQSVVLNIPVLWAKGFVLALYISFRSAVNTNCHHISHWLDSTRDLVGQICFGVPDRMCNYDICSVFDSSVLFLLIIAS